MAAYSFASLSPANALVDGLASIASAYDDGSGAGHVFSKLQQGKIFVKSVNLESQFKRFVPKGIEAELTWRGLVATTAASISGLSAFVATNHYTNAVMINGDIFALGGTNSGGTHNGVPKWKLVIDGNADGERYVDFSVKRRAVIASATAAIYDLDNGFLATFGDTPSGTDPLSETTQQPSGFRLFEVRNAGETLWESLGPIRGGKLECELVTTMDSEGRYVQLKQVKVNAEVDILDTSATTLGVLDTFAQSISNDVRLTLLDNVIITCADNLGVSFDYRHEKESEDAAFIKMIFNGIVPLTSWASGIWT